MPYIKPPNSKTWETIYPVFPIKSAELNCSVGKNMAIHFGWPVDFGKWLVDQAIESLTESPHSDGSHGIAEEAILIATRMGYITGSEYIATVHDLCVKNSQQSS